MTGVCSVQQFLAVFCWTEVLVCASCFILKIPLCILLCVFTHPAPLFPFTLITLMVCTCSSFTCSPMCISVCIPHSVFGSLSISLVVSVSYVYYSGDFICCCFWFLPSFVIVFNYVLTYLCVCVSAACAQVLPRVKDLNWSNNETHKLTKV